VRVPLVVVDTNVVVSAFLSGEASAPPLKILRAMLAAQIPFLLSVDLLAEYRRVLMRPAIQKRHGLKPAEVDSILRQIVLNCLWREASPEKHPSLGSDAHLWALLVTEPGSILVTGDQALIDSPPAFARVVSPRSFLKFF
jgi:putative PIN family toxin of toxin-antitoxin system